MRLRVPGRRLLAPAGRVALICVAVAIGGGLQWLDDHDEFEHRPYPVAGAMGRPARARTFDLTVLAERGASKIESDHRPHDTGGVWVLVLVRVAGRDRPVKVQYAAVRDGAGNLYRASDRVAQPILDGRVVQPGVPVEGEIAFEVPAAAAQRLTLLVDQDSIEHRMGTELSIALPRNTAQTVRDWQSAGAGPTTLAGSR